MTLFLWQQAEQVTDRYHDEAGIVVAAESLDLARQMVTTATESALREYGKPCSALASEPDVTMALADDVPAGIWIFPDAGCC